MHEWAYWPTGRIGEQTYPNYLVWNKMPLQTGHESLGLR